eukprot:scaffold4958_cov145-Skeletonema_marinoi.AAC.28
MLASTNTVVDGVGDVEEAVADDNVEENGDDTSNDDSKNNEPLKPLCAGSRTKGYILLLVSASLNFEAVWRLYRKQDYSLHTDLEEINWCIVLDNLSSFYDFVLLRRMESDNDIRYAMAAACITIIISSFAILCHFDCTSLRKTLWPKMFGPNKRVELCILIFLVIFWLVTIWFNTTIRGIAGEGNEQYNLYFTSWLCLWTTFWTLERWFVASVSFADFLFVLDAMRNWDEGTAATPYVNNMFANVSRHEWGFLLTSTITASIVSLCWILAEIFRRNKKEGDALKSDVENYVEGIALHLLAIEWIILIFFTTMPGHAASLIGNLYFSTWATCFSIIATLIWWLRDWRKDIADTINDQQAEYERAKRAILRREEQRLAQARREDANDQSDAVDTNDSNLDEIVEEDAAKEDIVDDDITVSIASVSGNRTRTDTIDSSEDQRAVCFSARSLFVSARDNN